MDIAQIREVFLNDPNAVEDTVPSSIQIDFDRGLNGDRGSYIIPGLGNPNNYNFTIPSSLDNEGKPQVITPQPFDWFINLKPTDPTYLTMFYLEKTGQVWEKIFKLFPNVYNRNFVGTFVAGQVSKMLSISSEALPLEQLFGDQTVKNDFDIYRIPDTFDTVYDVDSEEEMLGLAGLIVGDYAYRTDRSQFFRLFADDATILSSWQSELSITASIDVETPTPNTAYPIVSGFLLSAPFFDGTNYNFPIIVTAAEAKPTGFEAVSGDKTVHVSISVV
jgi:hypothetical protein